MKYPSTTEEWQEAVNLSDMALRIGTALAYGILVNGPEVNTGRCRVIIAAGATKGVKPNWTNEQIELYLRKFSDEGAGLVAQMKGLRDDFQALVDEAVPSKSQNATREPG